MRRKAKGILIVVILAAVLALLFLLAVRHSFFTEDLVYAENLDLTAVTVEGTDLTLYDLAFYIGFEEKKCNEQALIYDRDHPQRYWNIHTNGEFLRVTARSDAVDMMVHDEVYSTEAVEAGLSLTEEEQGICAMSAEDFWNDLSEAQRDALGIPVEKVYEVCEQIGLSEKYTKLLAEEEGRDFAVFQVGGKAWEEKRDGMDIIYHKNVLNRIQMGQVTLGLTETELLSTED